MEGGLILLIELTKTHIDRQNALSVVIRIWTRPRLASPNADVLVIVKHIKIPLNLKMLVTGPLIIKYED